MLHVMLPSCISTSTKICYFAPCHLQLSSEMIKARDELNQKIMEIRRLQMEMQRKDKDEADERVEILKKTIMDLEKENVNLKVTLISL